MKAAGAGMVIAMVLGAALALMRLSRTAPVRWFAAAWVEFFRGFPLLLLIFFTFFALPKYGIDMTPFRALVLALSLYNGAMLGEIFRAGILSLDRGQSEAAVRRRTDLLAGDVPRRHPASGAAHDCRRSSASSSRC